MRHPKTIQILALFLGMLVSSSCGRQTTEASVETIAAVYTFAAQTADAKSTLLFVPTDTPVYLNPTQTSTATGTSTRAATATAYWWSVSTAATSTCDNSAFVADITYPDYSVLAPDTAFDKTWSFENTGTCTWDDDYSIVFVSGDDMDGDTTYLDDSIDPGDEVEITVSMVSSSDDGTYTGYWRLVNADGVQFGVTVYVIIEVSSGVTSTPALTATSAADYTSTFTPENTSTFTFTPTDTETATLVP